MLGKTNQNAICFDLNTVEMCHFVCKPVLCIAEVFVFVRTRIHLCLCQMWIECGEVCIENEKQWENDGRKRVFQLLMNRRRRNKKNHEIWRSDSWIKFNFPYWRVWGVKQRAYKKETKVYMWHVTLTHPFLRVIFFLFLLPSLQSLAFFPILSEHSFNSCDTMWCNAMR